MPPWFELPANPVDLALLILLLLYAWNGWSRGWLPGLVDLAGLVLALLVGLRFYQPVSAQLITWTGLAYGLAKPAAFFLVWLGTDLLYGSLARRLFGDRLWRRPRSLLERVLGVWPGLARGLVVATVLLTAVSALPLDAPIGPALETSRLKRALEPRASALAEQLGPIFGDAAQETIGLLTVRPQSDERVNLRFRVTDAGFDQLAELRMLDLVNRERTERGLPALRADPTLHEIARRHSRDMFQRSYFAHLDPEGQSPFDRMLAGGARFRAAGENLALAPTVEVAHTGLMNSPGHRQNILNGGFGRIGIGIADGGLHGKMVTQTFAD
jgi:uncharacterized protein YkwD/uncharacterized membrane protein required for colicin V production